MSKTAQSEPVNNAPSSAKKPYKTPRVIEYGSITRLTQTAGAGAINDGNPGNPGRNKSR